MVQTQFGPCDPETAAFLAAEGFGTGTPAAAGARAEEADTSADRAGLAGSPG